MDEERNCSSGDPDLKVQQYLEQVIVILCPQHFDDVWRCLRIWLRQTNHDYQEEEDHDTGAVDDDSEYYLFCHIEQLYSAGSRLGSSASNYNWCWYRPPRTTGIHIYRGTLEVSFELKNPQKACYKLMIKRPMSFVWNITYSKISTFGMNHQEIVWTCFFSITKK